MIGLILLHPQKLSNIWILDKLQLILVCRSLFQHPLSLKGNPIDPRTENLSLDLEVIL